jgi:GT2 family glycosyltransferase
MPASEFIQLPRNTGYAGGNNVGIKLALEQGADFVFIVNPDIRLPPDCLDAYLKTFSSDVKIGALNSIQVQSDGVSVDPKFGQVMLGPFGYAGQGFKVGDIPPLWESKTLLGAALMIRARCLEQVGGFDPLYFAYGEEEDLCRRLRHHGFRLMVQHDPVVVHLRTKEGSAVSDLVLFLRLKGSYLYRIKNFGGAFHKNLVGRIPASYPYDRFPIRRKHVAATFIWLLAHAWQAYRHRRGEFIGRMYV